MKVPTHPIEVPCHHCGAKAGKPCRQVLSGDEMPGYHFSRLGSFITAEGDALRARGGGA